MNIKKENTLSDWMALTVKVECLLEGNKGSGEEEERPLGETRVLVKVDLSWIAIGEEEAAIMREFVETECLNC